MTLLVDLSYITYKWAFTSNRMNLIDTLANQGALFFMDGAFNLRKSLYPWYKKNRDNESLIQTVLRNEAKAFQLEVLHKYPTLCFAEKGYEADDLIAINVKQYPDCTIMSEDHDFLTLPFITLVNQYQQPWNINRIKTKLPIKQGRSYLAYQLLMGCITDTVPRCIFTKDRTTAPFCFKQENPLQTAIDMLPENLVRASLNCLMFPSPLFTNEDSIEVALQLEY